MIQEQPQAQRIAPVLTIAARNLSVAYDSVVALKIPKLECSGGVLAVVGHNGAGKSTLIKSVLGLLPPTGGSLEAQIQDSDGLTRLLPEHHMAFCPETGAVFADISVESYIKLWCRVKHNNPNFYRQAGSRYVELLNLVPLMRKLGRELSKGQRRRVQTAIGFLTQPKLFLFDEPFDGLDVQRTSELAELIVSHRDRMTFIISSHRMDVMERMADKLLVLKEGAIASSGAVEAVCSELAGKTFLISHLKNPEQFRINVQAELPHALVTRIGGQLFVTDRALSAEKLQATFKLTGESGAEFEINPPRLVDAMNYHLAEMRRENLH